jgi:2,3-bisphosphoglycerate-dependent phosphoglycerate mutase
VPPRIYLVRHAQSGNNAQPVEQRTDDPSITCLGHQQAEKVAERLAVLSLGSLVCSAFRRALQTAYWISRSTRLVPEVIVDLHERGGCYAGWQEANFTGMPGLTPVEVVSEFGPVQLPGCYPKSGWWGSRPRESQEACAQRAVRMADELKTRVRLCEKSIVCVTHADFLSQLLLAMLGDELRDDEGFSDLKNAGITQVGLDETGWKLYELNSVDHLPDLLVTS